MRVASRTARTPFDWDCPRHLGRQSRGVDSVYVCYSPDLALPGRGQTIAAFTARARAHGVSRLVLLSGRGEDAAQRCEQIVIGSGIATTVVRCACSRRTSRRASCSVRSFEGDCDCPAGDVAEPFVDLEDVCDIITLALTEPGHDGRLYELTGPESLQLCSDRRGAERRHRPGDRLRVRDQPTSSPPTSPIDGCPGEDAACTGDLVRGDPRRPQRGHHRHDRAGPRPTCRHLRRLRRRTAATGIWSVDQAELAR